METEKKSKSSGWFWKLGFMLLLGIVFGIYLAKTVLAYDVIKWQICNGLNMTGGQCDDFWFQLKGDVKDDTLNNFYNKTQIDLFMNELKAQMGNLSVNFTGDKALSNFILTNYYNTTTIDNKINFSAFPSNDKYLTKDEWRNNLSLELVTDNELQLAMNGDFNDSSSNNFWDDYGFILIIGLLVAAGFVFMISKKKKDDTKRKSFHSSDDEQAIKFMTEKMKEVNKQQSNEENQGVN